MRRDLDSDTGEVEWYTPPEVFTALDLVFDLDPAAPPGGVPWIPAKRYFTITDDGLAQEWKGLVWLNPPYSGSTPVWLEKLAAHGNGIALVNAHVETRWFHQALATATAVGFVRRRIAFVRRDGARPGPASVNSVFIAWGETAAQALERSGLAAVVRPVHGTESRVSLGKPKRP